MVEAAGGRARAAYAQTRDYSNDPVIRNPIRRLRGLGARAANTAVGRPGLLAMAALLGWMGVILFLSSRSSFPLDASGRSLGEVVLGEYRDEVGHLVEYTVLGLLTYTVFSLRLAGVGLVLAVVAFCVTFALADEAFQSLTPNRASELRDVAIDALGVGVAVAFLKAVETTTGQRLLRQVTRYVPLGKRERVP